MWNTKLFLFISAVALLISFKHINARSSRKGWKNVYIRDYQMYTNIASIQYMLDDPSNTSASFVHFCTGSILDQQHVVTSASCFDNLDANAKLAVNLGVTENDVRGGHSQFILVDQRIIHPEYNKENKKANVAVLILKDPITFNYLIKSVPFIGKELSPSGQGFVIGWNERLRRSHITISKRLQMAPVSVLSLNECESYYPQLLDDQFCIGGMETSDAPCRGTPGFPYIQTGQRAFVAGMATYWPDRCEGPALFTALNKYFDFLMQYHQQKPSEN